jgi:hypothetical protein
VNRRSVSTSLNVVIVSSPPTSTTVIVSSTTSRPVISTRSITCVIGATRGRRRSVQRGTPSAGPQARAGRVTSSIVYIRSSAA